VVELEHWKKIFHRRKVKINQIREKLDKLEQQGITEFGSREIHDYLYHDYNPPGKLSLFLFPILPVLILLLLLMLS
jgi:hypothetical protein